MSQRRFAGNISQEIGNRLGCTHGPVNVLTGWDRPLRCFFLMIDHQEAGENEEIIYSNLDDPTLPFPGGMDIEQVIEMLNVFGLEIPTMLRLDLENDKIRNAGNELHFYEKET